MIAFYSLLVHGFVSCGKRLTTSIATVPHPADAAIALQLAASGGWDPAADVDGDRRITRPGALMIWQAAGGTIEL